MELLYAVHKKPRISNYPQFQIPRNNQRPTICTVSTRNIIAYTTDTETTESDNNLFSGCYVYVADLNTPWLSYKVTSNKFPISVLKWDTAGKHLLIGDISGNVQIWVQKDNLLSEWMQCYHVRFPGEHVICAVFFHNGRKLVIQTDKKDICNYSEKYQRIKFMPTCRSFGGVPADGVLVVTATGLLGAFLIPSDMPNYKLALNQTAPQLPYNLPSVTRSLGHTRSFLTCADISYAKNGNLLIAVANGTCGNLTSTMIHCHRVAIKKQMDNLIITSQTLPSFFLVGGAARDIPGLRITNLKWMSIDDSDSLLVGTRTLSGSFIELWRLVEKATPIHSHFKNLFQQPNKAEVFKTVVWTHQVNYRYTSRIVDICTSKFHYGSASFIFVSMGDNTIHCLHRDTLKRVTIASLTSVWRNDGDHLSKQCKLDSTLVAHDITFMGHLLMAVDEEGQLFAYRITYPHQDPAAGQQSISYAISLLEYCLVGGYDAFDVFLTPKVQQLDTIIDRLTDNYSRQHSHLQQFYYVNFFALKTNLYRLSISGQPKAHDLTSFMMLHSILIGFKSLLRPTGLSSHDKGPAENLAMVLSESVPADIDKVLLGLEAKEFTVEITTLQSLQQLIQWVADLALNILAKLPENKGMVAATRNNGYDISKDIAALNSIRELLVMTRIWGLLRAQCLPVFTRSAENLDVLATLFRLLTRLTLNPHEPDEILLDECCLLPSQVLIPQLQMISPQYSVASPIIFYLTNNNLPLRFEYNIKPQCLKFSPEISTVEGGLSNNNIIDSIRHIQLGKRPASVRRCTRCGAYSSLYSVARTAAMKAWEQRWSNGCRCGGSWRLQIS